MRTCFGLVVSDDGAMNSYTRSPLRDDGSDGYPTEDYDKV